MSSWRSPQRAAPGGCQNTDDTRNVGGDTGAGDGGGPRLQLVLGDRRLTMPAALEPAVRRLLDGEPHRVGDLADLLDAPSRRVLVRRLVREGILCTRRAPSDA